MTDSPADDAKPIHVTPGCPVRITTGSRLHFGLLDTVKPFGGVGVMIDQPVTEVVVSASDRFDCDHESEPRLHAIAERVAKIARLPGLPNCRIQVTSQASQHCGLGSGTQLTLAAAEAVCRFLGVALDTEILATQITMRGQRSAVGVHGYFCGGLIYEGGEDDRELNPLKHRVELPSHWCIGIFRPTRAVQSISGDTEREQFANLSPAADAAAAELKRIVTHQIMPAAQQADFHGFATSVHRYNHESGRLFAAAQGGAYHGRAVTDVVQTLTGLGAHGVGQSSWGPGVFAWFDSKAAAEELVDRLPAEVSLVAITHPRNQPRSVQETR